MIPWWATDFGEEDIAAVSAAIRSRHISQGPMTQEFEERLGEVLGVPYVVCTSSGTTAITMGLLACGIRIGDEVIVPNRTWIATAHAVMMTGAKVRLIDVGPRGVLDDTAYKTNEPEVAENNHRDAFGPLRHNIHMAWDEAAPFSDTHWHRLLHWHGVSPPQVIHGALGDGRAYIEHDISSNMQRDTYFWAHAFDNAEIGNSNTSPLFQCNIMPVHLNGRFAYVPRGSIEDSCQAFPKPPEGMMACYSFSTAKVLPTGQGGCVATQDEGLYKELKALRTHAVENAMVPQVLQWKRFGYNFRYTDIQAAIGLSQLDRLQERIDRLHEIHGLYADELPAWLELLPSDGVPLYAEVLYQDSEKLRAYLLENGIQARPNYPSLNTAPYLNETRRFPNSERFEHGLTLPSGPAQTDEDIERVIEVVHGYRI